MLLLSFTTSLLTAKGSPAGIDISNTALIEYAVDEIEYNLTSTTDTFLVDKIVDIDIFWQDSAAVEVGAGENDGVLTFMLINQGNADENITLAYEHNSSSQYTPQNPLIYTDTNQNGIYDKGTDLPIGDITLTADANATLFIVADTPDANQSIGDRSYDGIQADAQSTNSQTEDNQHQIDTVIRKGSALDVGEYIIRDYWIDTHKSATLHSDDNQTHTGTIITYTIDISIGGNSEGRSITAINLQDTIPKGTEYLAGTLRLDDTSLSDADDTDDGSYASDQIKVHIDKISNDAHAIVRFDVQVQ